MALLLLRFTGESATPVPWSIRWSAVRPQESLASRGAPVGNPRAKKGPRRAEHDGALSPVHAVFSPIPPACLMPAVPPTASAGLGSLDVNRALGQLGQQLVGLPFLVEGLLQDLGELLVADLLRPGADGAVARDLVVLDLLGDRDQGGVHDVVF